MHIYLQQVPLTKVSVAVYGVGRLITFLFQENYGRFVRLIEVFLKLGCFLFAMVWAGVIVCTCLRVSKLLF
jgi:hypothetical protein